LGENRTGKPTGESLLSPFFIFGVPPHDPTGGGEEKKKEKKKRNTIGIAGERKERRELKRVDVS
jgi:hypothetical protein